MQPRPPPDELDELTLARAQRGDPRARRDLVVRYQRPVFALLSRMLHCSPGVFGFAGTKDKRAVGASHQTALFPAQLFPPAGGTTMAIANMLALRGFV